MQTVVVDRVEGPENGWYKVFMEDGTQADTKNEAIAELARDNAGVEMPADINTVKRGTFTNTYLNGLGDIADSKKPSGNGGQRRQSTGGGGGGRNDEARQKLIAAQWAFGRAVEVLIGSGEDFVLPLDADTQAKLEKTAKFLSDASKKLAG